MNNEVIENSHISDERVCLRYEVGIAYSADVDKALDILQRVAESHPLCLDVRKPEDLEEGLPKVKVRVVNLGESSVVIRAWIWSLNPENSFALRFDMNKNIKKQFDKEGIEIPFPQRVIHMRS
jgi:small conductance mechanosensitive channel